MVDVNHEAKSIESEIIGWRRTLHQNPELDTNLPETTTFIKTRLEEMGF